jgi:hypothetical protein
VADADGGEISAQPEFLLGDRMQSAALDIIEGLVEATYTRNRPLVLRAVDLKLEQTRYLVRLATDLKRRVGRTLSRPIGLRSAAATSFRCFPAIQKFL